MSETRDGMERFRVPQCKWDSKTSPNGFWIFLAAMSSVVRTSTHWRGNLLEEFLDAKLKRAKVKKSSVPSYILEDPDFAMGPSTGTAGAPGSPAATGSRSSGAMEADSGPQEADSQATCRVCG